MAKKPQRGTMTAAVNALGKKLGPLEVDIRGVRNQGWTLVPATKNLANEH